MQDRFKYRAWNKLQNKMFYVINISWFYEEIKRIEAFEPETKKIFIFDEYDRNIENTILLQSTGLRDKNGKLIYEGDIVRIFNDDFENRHIVKFGDFAMYDFDFQKDFEKGSTAVYGWYLGGLTYPVPLSISLETSGLNIEVIGNIYENPELLKECEDE